MRLKFKQNEIFLLFISVVFLCLFFCLNIVEATEIVCCWGRDILCCYLFILVITLHRSVRYVSCIMIFIAGFILFNCSRIILSYFEIEWLKNSDKYIFYVFKTYGYLILFMDFPPAPFFARISWGGFNILFPLLFMFSPNKKEYKKYVIFYFLVSIASFLKGSRTTLLAPILFFVWYYFALYNAKDISLKKILLWVIVVAIIANTMLLVRGTEEVELSVFVLLFLLLKTQGVTYVFLGNYLDYANTFVHQSCWYIMYPLVSTYHWFCTPIYRQGQSVELVEHTLSLDDQLMYSVAPDLYLQGVGYGSSYIAELHALGGNLGVVVGSFFLGCAIKWFERNYQNSKMLLYFSWFAIPYLIRLSRDNFIPNFFMFIVGVFVYFLLKSFAQHRI